MEFQFVRPASLASLAFVTVAILALAGCSSGSTPPASGEPDVEEAATLFPQPYAGLQGRTIKAIAPERVDDILAGRGAGYALAAELNSYPGPTHILQMAEPLQLTKDQESTVNEVFKSMNSDARRLGEVFVSLEAELDQLFREGRIDRAALNDLTTRIAATEGQLRAIHLAAHLTMKEVLTESQIEEYDRLRGYADNGDGSGGEQHDGHTEGMTHS